MKTRPDIDPEMVQELGELAARIDGGSPTSDQHLVDTFNEMSGLSIPFERFQGVYGAQEHSEWVEGLLVANAVDSETDLSRERLVTLVQSVLDDATDDKQLTFVSTLVEKSLGVLDFTDAIYWPDQFFGHGDVKREHTAEEIADELLRKSKNRKPAILL